MSPRVTAAVVVMMLLVSGALAAQSELVLVKEGTTTYHRPDCPVVRDGKGVLAMTRAQAEGRSYKAHPDCDPSNPKAPAPKADAPPPATVYLDGSKYYHRSGCPRMASPDKAKAVSLEVAGKSHWPCPECKPPVRKKSIENAVPGTRRRAG